MLGKQEEVKNFAGWRGAPWLWPLLASVGQSESLSRMEKISTFEIDTLGKPLAEFTMI